MQKIKNEASANRSTNKARAWTRTGACLCSAHGTLFSHTPRPALQASQQRRRHVEKMAESGEDDPEGNDESFFADLPIIDDVAEANSPAAPRAHAAPAGESGRVRST